MTESPTHFEDAESQTNVNVASDTPLKETTSRFPLDTVPQAGQSNSSTSPIRAKDTGRAQSLSPATILRLQGLQYPAGDRRRLKSIQSSSSSPRGHEAESATLPFRSIGSGTQTSNFRSSSISKKARDEKPHSIEDNSLGSTYFDDISDQYERNTAQENRESEVWAEVQEALKLKQQVQVRLKAAPAFTNDGSLSIAKFSLSAVSQDLLVPFPSGRTIKSQENRYSENFSENEVLDFSPSVGIKALHPVPSSSNDGATLDWSGDRIEEDRHERRWSMPLHRRVSKEKSPPRRLGIAEVVEKQESLYADKILRIKARATPHTLRKAQITRNQLERRYRTSQFGKFNLINVVRWLSSREIETVHALDEAEPLSWLRHLMKKSEANTSKRLPWHLSALIVEEYMRSILDNTKELFMSDGAVGKDREGLSLAEVESYATSKRPLSVQSAEKPFAKRKKSDDLISFEPRIQSRSSFGDESSWSQNQMHGWRNSLSGQTGSARDSLKGSLMQNIDHVEVPVSSVFKDRDRRRLHSMNYLGEDRKRHQYEAISPASSHASYGLSRRPYLDSPYRSVDLIDDGSSSNLASSIEESKIPQHAVISRREPNESDLKGQRQETTLSVTSSTQPLATPRPFVDHSLHNTEGACDKSDDVADNPKNEKNVVKTDFNPIIPTKDRLGLSRAVSLRSFVKEARSESVLQSANAVPSERKKEVLNVLKQQNSRMKNVLQTAVKALKDHNELHSQICDLLQHPYKGMQPEQLACLTHDPASVTGSTRNLIGWKAVEDIHHRLAHQRQILNEYLNLLPASSTSSWNFAREKSISQSNLLLLKDLYKQHQLVSSSVEQTDTLLLTVKNLRKELKINFDATEKHTSGNYPELIRLESLLDRLANRSNHLRSMGERFLSLVLRATAPFMKTFGRPIWNDVHDFLIIPWYRNTFSGEEHWYPVKFPRRTPLHWVKLLIFTSGTFFLFTTSLRAIYIIFPARHIISLPYLVPWLLMYSFFCSSILTLSTLVIISSVTLVGEIVMVMWWIAWTIGLVK